MRTLLPSFTLIVLITPLNGALIKAPFSGVIKTISVKEGNKVRKGDTLLSFDPEVSRKRKETLEVQLKLEEKRFEEESRSIRAREQSVRAKRDGYARSLETEQEIYENILPLASGRIFS